MPTSKRSETLRERTLRVITKALHKEGDCGFDGGTWEQLSKSGYECECFDLAKVIQKALRFVPRDDSAQLIKDMKTVVKDIYRETGEGRIGDIYVAATRIKKALRSFAGRKS